MNVFFKIILTALLLSVISCGRIATFADDDYIARVGDKRLRMADVESIFTPGITPEDSVKLLDSYVDKWVKRQLKLQAAEENIGNTDREIEKMVAEYRNSLMSLRFEQEFLTSRIDTLITDGQITEYYESHSSDYILDRDIVKGRIVSLPSGHRQKNSVTRLMTAAGDMEQDLHDIVQKNNFEITEYTAWTDMGEFLSALPAGVLTEAGDISSRKGLLEFSDGDRSYLVLITALRTAGQQSPLERVREQIVSTIMTHRRTDALRSLEDSVYNAALEARTVEIRIPR